MSVEEAEVLRPSSTRDVAQDFVERVGADSEVAAGCRAGIG